MAGNGDSAARADEKLNCYVLAWEVGVVFTPTAPQSFPASSLVSVEGEGATTEEAPPPSYFLIYVSRGKCHLRLRLCTRQSPEADMTERQDK